MKDLAPRPIDARDLRSGALGHVDHAAAEHAVDAHDHRVAGLDQVHDRGLHAGRAGAAHGHRHAIRACESRVRSICCMSFISSK